MNLRILFLIVGILHVTTAAAAPEPHKHAAKLTKSYGLEQKQVSQHSSSSQQSEQSNSVSRSYSAKEDSSSDIENAETNASFIKSESEFSTNERGEYQNNFYEEENDEWTSVEDNQNEEDLDSNYDGNAEDEEEEEQINEEESPVNK
ncbi:jg16196, partial [Pararge aegeria aegeria]